MTMTALHHCKVRVTSCSGRAMAVEKSIVAVCGLYYTGSMGLCNKWEEEG